MENGHHKLGSADGEEEEEGAKGKMEETLLGGGRRDKRFGKGESVRWGEKSVSNLDSFIGDNGVRADSLEDLDDSEVGTELRRMLLPLEEEEFSIRLLLLLPLVRCCCCCCCCWRC